MSTESGTGAGSASTSSSVNLESVRAVAKKDFQDAVRSWLFWGLSVFFFVLLVGITGLLSYFGEDIAAQGQTTEALVGIVYQMTRVVIPLIALVLGWKAIAGERETGSIKILLSLPHSRKDVLLGKLIGRSAVLSVSLIAGFVMAAVVVAALLGSFDIVDYAGLLAMSIIYAVAYTSIAVSISSLYGSTTKAGVGCFGVFLLFYLVWGSIQLAVQLMMSRDWISGVTVNGFERRPNWAYFIDMLDPGNAYQNVLSLVTSVAELDQEALDAQAEFFGGSVPFYLQDWFSFVILLFWIVVPLAIALYRFDRVDL
ncbi:ABC transporter permease [Natronorubrum sp. FCH18a]|uniref:ABC transporter permease n=1 Tax=Natronorubrum sp. FCH18a TaxID=3447018 RepID=UPI003F510F87